MKILAQKISSVSRINVNNSTNKQLKLFSDNRESQVLQQKKLNTFLLQNKNVFKDKIRTIQRVVAFIPGVAGPYSHLADDETLAVDIFTSPQRKKVLSAGYKGKGTYTVGNAEFYRNDGKNGNKDLVAPITTSFIEAQIDHIVPKNKGGGNSYKNAQILDAHFNRSKGDKYNGSFSKYESGLNVLFDNGTILQVNNNAIQCPLNLVIEYDKIADFVSIGSDLTAPCDSYLPFNVRLSNQTLISGVQKTAGDLIARGTFINKDDKIPQGSHIEYSQSNQKLQVPNNSYFGIKTAYEYGCSPKTKFPWEP